MLPRLSVSRILLQSVQAKSLKESPRQFSQYEATTKAKSIPITHELHDIIKWRRPERLPFYDPHKSGDLKPLPPVDPKWLKLRFQPFQKLIQTLPEEHQKIFTVHFGPRKEGIRVIHDETYKSVRRHKYDGTVEQSIEHKVAWFTVRIRDLREILNSNEVRRNNGIFRKQAKELVEKRKKWLNHLRHVDYKRFEWLLETLGIMFRPNAQFEKIHRKESVTKLTDMLCEGIKARKMQAYKEELDKQKIPFLEEKLSILQEIRADEESMKLASSVTPEIEQTEKMLEQLRKTYLEIQPLKEEIVETDVVFS
jgi:ribosomal protein S15P/S13E